MTHERDFDRIARAWLDLMPDEAPDRTIAAVLQAVDATPQVRRPLRRLMRRFPTMTRFPVVASLAAALVLAVGGGLLLMRPNDQPGVDTPTPSPSVSPSPSGTAVPDALRSRWMGGNRAVAGIDPLAGTTVLFDEGSFVLTPSDPVEDRFISSSASTSGNGQIRLDKTTDGRCQYGDVGLYSWSLSPSGRTLTIAADSDACATRLAAVPGVWWQMACKDPGGDQCLGDLDAGTYKSQYIAPRLDPGAEWTPNFGAVTYTVPDGWANSEDFPNTFGLVPSSEYARVGSGPTTSMFLFTQPTAESQQTPCSGKPQAGIRRTVADEMRWLRQLPGLVTTQPATITVDGHQGQWIDLRLDPAWKTGCGQDKPLVEYLLSGDASEGIAGVSGQERQRLVLLDLGDGDLLGIVAGSSDPARFDAFAAEVMPIIQSFQFE